MSDQEKADLAKANRLLESFSRIAETINTPQISFARRSQDILRIILDYLGVEHGSIMMREGRNSLVVQAASRPELVGCRQKLDSGSVAAWVAKHKEPLYLPDIDKDPRFARRRSNDNQNSGQYRKNALLSAPIIYKNKVTGIINVTDKLGDQDLGRQDIGRLLEFGSVIISLLVQQSLQEQVRKQRNTLRQRNQELQRQEQLRSDLSRMLIHDLKGPLSEVVANLDILSYSIPDDLREFIESAQIGCDKATRMLNNLITIDKIEEGGMKPIKEQVQPESLVVEALSGIKGVAKIREIAIHQKLPAEPLPPLRLDRVLILRVMQNILTNAVGYSPANTEIEFGCRLLPDRPRFIEFYVRDQGPGIPAGKHQAIFEKYSRISDKQDGLVGTGLGLYFCKLAMELHGGEIGLESELGKGSLFFFRLPIS